MPERSTYLPGEPCWVDLVATDRDMARTFYADVFGWEISEGHASDSPYLVARLRGRTVAGISNHGADGPLHQDAGWTVYFCCDDVAALSRRVEAAGGRTVSAPLAEGGDGNVTTFRDPQDAVAGGWTPGRSSGAQLVDEAFALAWCALLTPDAEAAARFYAAALEVAMSPSDGGYRADPPASVGIEQTPGISAHWLPHFAVPDLDRAVAQARSADAIIDAEREPSPRGWRARLTDPQGGRFAVVSR